MPGFLLSGALPPTMAADDSEMDLTTASESSSSGSPRNGIPRLLHTPTNHARRPLLHPQVYVPFFTAQWTHKVHHAFAMPRGARDGAVIVNHLRRLFVNGLEDDGLLVNTSHVSMTFDGHSSILYIHCFDDITPTYHMERFWSGAVDEHDPCVMLRLILRDLEDWAVGECLEHIRASLDELHAYAVARNAYDESSG
jgi:hypothetical protein